MLNLSKFGIGLGENPNMTDPYVRAAGERIETACQLAVAVMAAGLQRLDLREFRNTPAGGFVDGAVVAVESAEQVAADLLRWHRPHVAFERVRQILEPSHD